MSAIRIRKTIDSETLTLPELKPFIGRTVEIAIEAESLPPGFLPGSGNWDEALAAGRSLVNYDYSAAFDLDAANLRDAEQNLQ